MEQLCIRIPSVLISLVAFGELIRVNGLRVYNVDASVIVAKEQTGIFCFSSDGKRNIKQDIRGGNGFGLTRNTTIGIV